MVHYEEGEQIEGSVIPGQNRAVRLLVEAAGRGFRKRFAQW